MSLFGSMMGDFDDDMFMNNPMNMMQMQMRNMNRMMNSLMPDPFNMLMPFDNGRQQNNMLMDRNHGPPGMNGFFGFPMANMNMNRLLNADSIAANGGTSYCSSSVISMSSGPDGRPQIYQATTSSKTGPGGIRETRKTVQDSMNGVKKMAIGHHIGERAHIIEKEEDLRSGQLEERQEFINLDEEEAELFDREFTTKANTRGRHLVSAGPHGREVLTIQDVDDEDEEDTHIGHRRPMLALPPAPSSQSKRSTETATRITPQNATTSQQHHGRETLKRNYNNNNNNNNCNNNNNNNNGNYVPSRHNVANQHNLLQQHHNYHRSHALGAMPRRSLRSLPFSSPLVMFPNMYHPQHHHHHHHHNNNNNNLVVTSSSVQHPHPYKNAMPSRRQRAKQQLQQQQLVEIEEQEQKQKHDVEEEEVIDDDEDDPQVIIEEPEDDDDNVNDDKNNDDDGVVVTSK